MLKDINNCIRLQFSSGLIKCNNRLRLNNFRKVANEENIAFGHTPHEVFLMLKIKANQNGA